MIHPVYTQTSSVNLTSNTNGYVVMSSDQIPLVKSKYLSEFRTELERAKVRKNLGIADDTSLLWGNIDGVIEEQQDLLRFIDAKWAYSSDLSDEITDIKSGLDYAIHYVSTFKSDSDTIEKCKQDIIQINDIIDNQLQVHLQQHDLDIEQIVTDIDTLTKGLEQLNQDLLNINVDPNIENWITNKQSNTIKLTDAGLTVNILESEDNAIESDNGLFVKDYSSDVKELQSVQQTQTGTLTYLQENLNKYVSNVPEGTTSPYNIGGIQTGTVVDNLTGKNISEILDAILFPAYVETLKYPELYYSKDIPTLVKVGSQVQYPTLNFIQNHAGLEAISKRTNVLKFNGQIVDTYSNLGTHTFEGTAYYNEGEKLINNRGEVTEFYVPAGSISTTLNVITTYPFYIGNTDLVEEYPTLIPFGVNSGNIEFELSGKAIIKLPGARSEFTLKLEGVSGFMDINSEGWVLYEEDINGVTYQVYEKSDSYADPVLHQINFKLQQ